MLPSNQGVLVLKCPGAFLDRLVPGYHTSWDALMGHIGTEYTEAHAAILLFEKWQTDQPKARVVTDEERRELARASRGEWEAKQARRAKVRKILGFERPGRPRRQPGSALPSRDEIRQMMELEDRVYDDQEYKIDLFPENDAWPSGNLGFVKDRYPYILIKSYLFSVDNIIRLIHTLQKEMLSYKYIGDIIKNIKAEFSDIMLVRNSLHHLDERLLMTASLKKSAPPLTRFYYMLVDDGLVVTIENNENAHIRATRDEFKKLHGILQTLLNQFEWTGRPRFYPHN